MAKQYSLPRLKTLRGYSEHARWISECGDITGLLARCQVEDIPSPYRYSPSIYIKDWNGKNVICMETAHRRYEVFEVPADLLRFKTDDDATAWHVRYCGK